MKRPQFTLRTLIVVLAIACIPMGFAAYQLNWIHQRHDFIKMLKAEPHINRDLIGASTEAFNGHPAPTISVLRKMAGDQAYSVLVLPEKYDPNLIDKANDLFPEARILAWSEREDKLRFTKDVTRNR